MTGKGDGKSEPPANPGSAGEKLQKVLAQAGLGSRREVERWIEIGRVKVNGERAHVGQRVGPDDDVRVDGGRPLGNTALKRHRVLLMNKNEGMVCTRRDPERRPTVFQSLPRLKQGRWISVGRLDINSSGLLLLCNDGDLAHKLMHPSTGLDREYAVRVDGRLSDEQVEELCRGVFIDGEEQAFSDLRYYDGSGRNHWYHAVLMEGRNREVRRLFETQGLQVSRLKRVRYGPVMLPPWLKRGRFAEMTRDDVMALYKLLGLRARLSPRQAVLKGATGSRNRSVMIPYPGLGVQERRD